MADVTFRIRALRPSQKSKMAATTIQMAAKVRLPFSEAIVEKHPQTRLRQVRVLGICCLMLILTIEL